jgi:hypothetical protein
MKSLDEIGKDYGTDKSSLVHDYLNKYPKHMPYYKFETLKILEIGVLDGGSLRTWRDYFYNSTIVGIDINEECKKHEEDRIIVEIGSQTDKEFLDSVVKKHGPFNMIIDDGSHMCSHVIFSFENLIDSVVSGGCYIVEDSSTSYWQGYEGGYRKLGTTIEYFKNMVDEINFNGEILYDKPVPCGRRDDYLIEHFEKNNIPTYGSRVESINFLNSIIVINKR